MSALHQNVPNLPLALGLHKLLTSYYTVMFNCIFKQWLCSKSLHSKFQTKWAIYHNIFIMYPGTIVDDLYCNYFILFYFVCVCSVVIVFSCQT